ncbi:hypothetical protein CsSME_00044563 [Camellia sinensis var. sinensis]|uniref:uncharacterized protein LOC114308507 n=1 Tax=Camellia sinensis TaxID=4442 RepID=UPI001035AA2F|nr:uncharacterized protein LOC114308507 [Camellia sinensis]
MKLSLKVQDQDQTPQSQHHHPLLLRAKVPITVFGLPFLSGISATDPSNLSLSLRSNFPSGPSLKLSYSPTTTTTTTPLSLTLKSGISLFGSPHNSPLIISAHFTVSPQNPNSPPSFSLQFKPQFGDFSLSKTTHSSNPNSKFNFDATSIGFVPLERPLAWKDLTLESKDSLLSGIAVTARTALPVTKRVAMNFRWGVNFPSDIRKQLPFLTVNKIGIERVDEVKETKEVKVKNSESNLGDLELLKGLCLSVTRELEVLQVENREIKQRLEEMRFGKWRGHSENVAKKVSPVMESSGEFEQWKSKKSGGEENGRKELKKNANRASDVESELQKAIMAAASQ